MKHRANRMLALVMALCLLPLVPLAAEEPKQPTCLAAR